MKRTQIYLNEKIYQYLKSERTGNSISEIIKAIDETAGIWKNKIEDVNEFIRSLRKGSRVDNIDTDVLIWILKHYPLL